MFEHRTVQTLGDELERLVADRDNTEYSADLSRPVTPAFHNGRPPLSFAQRRVWYLEQLQPGNAAYNIAFALELRGSLVTPVLEQSLTEIMRRHEVLRSRFVMVGDEPAQIADPTMQFVLRVTDLSSSDSPYQEARKELARDAGRPFDLAAGPVFRARLLRITDRVHVLGFVLHHIAADGWSIDVLLRELDVLYQAFVNRRRSPLERPVLQYADFAVWQMEVLGTTSYQRQLAYWQKKLGGDVPILDLPTDRVRPAVQRYRGATVTFDCSVEIMNRLEHEAKKHDVTLFMMLFAAFNCLLHRYTGGNDLPIATPVANRSRPETADIIGFFANTLVLRTDLTGVTGFNDVLQRVRTVCIEAFENQDPPFEQLVESLKPVRDLSRNALFQVMFAFQETNDRVGQIGDIKVDEFDFSTSVSRFDLYLWIQKTRHGLRGTLEYNTDLFDAKTIRRLSDHYRAVLECVATNCDVVLAQIPILSENEQTYLIHGVNETRGRTAACCVHQLFEQQVPARANQVAVQCGDESLTYAELNTRANSLACYLRGKGITNEYLVGIAVPRSVDMMVAVLGVLKSGAAYLPLDLTYPIARLGFMVADSGVACVLTNSSQQHQIEAVFEVAGVGRNVDLVCMDTDWPTIEEYANDSLEVQVDTTNLAYVMYTSGSTGTPKGVEIQHDSVVNFLESMRREPGVDERDVMFAVTTLSFDISVLELFLPIIVGARVVIGTQNVVRDSVALGESITEAGATVVQATPATWRGLLASGWKPGALNKVLCGGEALSPNLARELLTCADEVWNLYGPTEATVWATCQRVTNASTLAIGHPIANTRVYILDADLQPVPLGVKGDLYIAGAGLARGYRGRPDLTATNFLTDPFVGGGKARMYRTGDIARRRQDGSIEWWGRVDRQAKIRGYRIEPGDIEAALAEHPGITDCVAVVRAMQPEDMRLIAYVVQRSGVANTGTEFRRYLRDFLPDFMLPQHFVMLNKLPLSAAGKIDYHRLPLPWEVVPESTGYAEPRTEMERQIAGIWSEVLGVARIGRYANFFELGGHSLLSMTVVARVERELGCQLSPRALILDSLCQIAAECDQQRSASDRPEVRGVTRWPGVFRDLKRTLLGR